MACDGHNAKLWQSRQVLLICRRLQQVPVGDFVIYTNAISNSQTSRASLEISYDVKVLRRTYPRRLDEP